MDAGSNNISLPDRSRSGYAGNAERTELCHCDNNSPQTTRGAGLTDYILSRMRHVSMYTSICWLCLLA